MAMEWLRAHGEIHAADLAELAGLASGLMTLGRFTELVALASRLAERHRAHGPATLAYFGLGMLGYAAQLQGRYDDAARCFTESARIEVPAGTYMVSRPV
jgi:hypothetical protein